MHTDTSRRNTYGRNAYGRQPSASPGERPGQDPSLVALRGTSPAHTSIVDSVLRTVRQYLAAGSAPGRWYLARAALAD